MSAQDTLSRAHGTVAEWMLTSKFFLMRGRVKEKVILKLQDKDVSFEDF